MVRHRWRPEDLKSHHTRPRLQRSATDLIFKNIRGGGRLRNVLDTSEGQSHSKESSFLPTHFREPQMAKQIPYKRKRTSEDCHEPWYWLIFLLGNPSAICGSRSEGWVEIMVVMSEVFWYHSSSSVPEYDWPIATVRSTCHVLKVGPNR